MNLENRKHFIAIVIVFPNTWLIHAKWSIEMIVQNNLQPFGSNVYYEIMCDVFRWVAVIDHKDFKSLSNCIKCHLKYFLFFILKKKQTNFCCNLYLSFISCNLWCALFWSFFFYFMFFFEEDLYKTTTTIANDDNADTFLAVS